MKFGVVVFPGSNCDHDCYHTIQAVIGKPVEFIWHQDTSLNGFDAVILPGGFSYGDYLRTGALARFSPVMQAVKSFADRGGLVIGICNGFQILTEAGLLPGALLRNSNMKYICKFLQLRTETTDTPFSNQLKAGQILNIPIGHGEGNYFADESILKELEDNRQVVFRYVENPNGSLHDIAGIVNKQRNVLGMMPHPDRSSEALLGSTDGKAIFESMVNALAGTGMRGMISAEQLSQHGISDSEYERIQNILKREPTFTELGIFSVMWSEHCSYKSSRVHLRRLPTKGKAVLQGPGENAGIIDIGDGQAVAYKIESHNHPSYIEPFQGAATGVGGILRDIFTMGARPIAAMNSLRFGTLDSTQNRHIMEGVVGGIAFYGNCFGVPTIGGEVAFAKCYAQNPLVNAFALGLFEKDKIFYGRAEGVGNPVIYVGAKTGRDGIHGATMASAGFGEDAGAKRPNVQIGDPFMEKLLLEACLEAMDKGLIVGIQDMGAAGLTSSSCEMGARAGTGVEMELDLVPQREESMTAYEIMLSESQERMLLVAEKEKEQDIFAVFHKWGLDAVTVGRVTSDGLLRIKQHGQVMAEIPNKALADEGPRYERPMQPAGPPEPTMSRIDRFSFLDGCDESVIQEFLSADRNPGSANFNHLLLLAVASPNLCSREWVWEQYDHMVQSNTMVGPGSDAAVIRIKGTQKALVMTLDGPAFRIAQQPREGARMMVAEAARNIVCSGGRPLAATNCLNFGNPEHPEVMWQFSEVVDGMSEACTAFETPITGGNVSFYNETLGGNIYPTPVLGMVGVIEDVKHVTPSFFRNAGDAIVLLEADNLSADSINLESERALQALVHQTIRDGLILSAHDVSEGGMAVALAECCYSSTQHPAVGATVKISAHEGFCKDLFGESPSRIIVSTQNSKELISRAKLAGLRSWELGKTGGNRLTIHLDGRPDAESAVVDLAVGEVESAWRRTFPKLLS